MAGNSTLISHKKRDCISGSLICLLKNQERSSSRYLFVLIQSKFGIIPAFNMKIASSTIKVSMLSAKKNKQIKKPTVKCSMVSTWGPMTSGLNFNPLRFSSKSYQWEIKPLESNWWNFSLNVVKIGLNNGNITAMGIVYTISSNNSIDENPLRYKLLLNCKSNPFVEIIVPLFAGSATIS